MMTLIEMGIGELIADLQKKFGRDLSNYRLACLQRRVSLRMSALGVSTLERYKELIGENPDEIDRLLDTVTIHVTEFFRDQDVFDAITNDIMPELVERKLRSPSRTIRVWSAGCSTGEEAYSLAILMMQYLRTHELDLATELYATDISKDAVAVGREGVYAEKKVSRIPANLRRRYFERDGEGYRVAAHVRRQVKFSIHDLFSEPPFSLLDVILCRNVLIHFDGGVRNNVLVRFHKALGENGTLILGKSEAVMGMALVLYDLVDPRNKIYRKVMLTGS
jgi:two-component system CheB/CheR fusion protein